MLSFLNFTSFHRRQDRGSKLESEIDRSSLILKLPKNIVLQAVQKILLLSFDQLEFTISWPIIFRISRVMTFLEGLKLKFFSSRIFPPFSTVFAMKLSKMSKSIPFSLRIVATDDRYDSILEIFSFFERISHSTNLVPVFDDWLLFRFKLFIEQKAFQTFQAIFIQRQLAEEYTAEIREAFPAIHEDPNI